MILTILILKVITFYQYLSIIDKFYIIYWLNTMLCYGTSFALIYILTCLHISTGFSFASPGRQEEPLEVHPDYNNPQMTHHSQPVP